MDSSPAKRRSERTSASATPRRSARGQNSQIPDSSPAPAGPDEQLQSEASQASQRGSLATPRNARFQTTSTQSPLFFRSRLPTPPAQDKLMARMRAMVVRHQKRLHRRWGIRRPFTTHLALALAVPAMPKATSLEAAAVPFSYVAPNPRLAIDGATSTQTSLAQALPIADAGYLSMKMACLYRNLQTHQPSPISTLILQTRRSWAGTPLESFGEPTYRS